MVIIYRLRYPKDLLEYNDSVFVLDQDERRVLETLDIDYIKRFEQETGFFTHKGYSWSSELEMFTAFSLFFHKHTPKSLVKIGIDFKNGDSSYEEFLDQLAKCLDIMKKDKFFGDFPNYPNYDWLRGEFRNAHPEIFIDFDAPNDLKNAFYKNRINPDFLFLQKRYIPYLIDKNLSNILNVNINLNIPGLMDARGYVMPTSVNFIDEYVSRFGNLKLLKLISKYGNILSDITISSLHNEIEDEQAIEKSLKSSIYNKIINGKMNYSYLSSVPDMVREYPEIFVNFYELTSIPTNS